MLSTFTLASLLAQLFLAALSSEGTCTTGNDPTNCKDGACNVQIGSETYCSQCATDGEGPINGKCTKTLESNTCASKVCTSCAAGYFLYKGGCYKFGELPGKLICNDVAAAPGGRAAVDGVCSECNTAGGFFKHPDAVATKQSCILCNETENISNVKGVVGCSACTPPASAGTSTPTTAVCTKCDTTKYLKKADDGTTTCISANECVVDQNKFFKVEDPIKKCVSCGDAQDAVDGCDMCTYDSGTKKVTCTKCTSNYLKTAADGTTTCVEKTECTETTFPKEDNSNGNKCLSCGDTTNGVPNCAKCTLPSGATKPTCSECGSGYKLEGETCAPGASTPRPARSRASPSQ